MNVASKNRLSGRIQKEAVQSYDSYEKEKHDYINSLSNLDESQYTKEELEYLQSIEELKRRGGRYIGRDIKRQEQITSELSKESTELSEIKNLNMGLKQSLNTDYENRLMALSSFINLNEQNISGSNLKSNIYF